MSTASENVTVMFAVGDTRVRPFGGFTLSTDGAVASSENALFTVLEVLPVASRALG